MSLDRLSISHRIYFGFGLLVIALLALGSFAIVQFDKMSASSATITQKVSLVSQSNEYVISLYELSDSILVYAQSTDLQDRKKVDVQLAETLAEEKRFVRVLTDSGLGDAAIHITTLSATYNETLESLLLRVENIGASADMILTGAGQLTKSAPELSEKLQKLAQAKPDYAALADMSQKIVDTSNQAVLDTMTYAIKPSDETLQIARDSAAGVDETLGETKSQMAGLSRRDKKILKFVGRDNDLLKQGYVQFQGSNLGLKQSYNAYLASIEQTMAEATKIRQLALQGQNTTIAGVIQSSATTKTSYMITMVVVSVLAAVLGLVISRSIIGPVGRVTQDMKTLGEGNTDIEVSDRERHDEVGDMARAVVIFRQNALEVDRLSEQRLKDQKRDEEKRSAALVSMADTIESETGVVLEKVALQTRELGTAVGGMSQSSHRVATQADTVAHEAKSSLELAERVADSAQALAGSIEQVAEKVERQRSIAQTALGQVETSSTAVGSLSEAADRIGSVIALINDIAAQTNMLALNATIEAERAGVAGKGFAVVASEVKQLAFQTSEATAQISEQIEDIRNVTHDCVTSIGQINQIVDDMATISSEVSQSVEHQTRATRDITENVQNAYNVSERLNGEVTAASEEMQGVRVLSDDLQALSQRVRSMVESLQMSLNTAIRTASESLNLERHEDKTILVEQDVDVILKGEGGTFRSQLLDISNNAMALSPPLDVKLGQEYKAEIQGLPGSFTIEVLSKRGLQAEKTRIRFVDEMEERGEIVRFVVGLWANRLRPEFGLSSPAPSDTYLKQAAQ